LGSSIIALGRLIVAGWQGSYLLWAIVLAAAEAIYSHRVLHSSRSLGTSMMRYRLVEIGILMILIRILAFTDKPWPVVVATLQTIASQPFALFDGEYVFAVVISLLAWAVVNATMNDFEELYDPYNFRQTNVMPIDKLAVRFFLGGGLLVFIAGATLWISREGVESLMNLERDSIGGVILNVLIYFMLGLIMLSQVRLTALLTRWHIQRVKVAEGLGKQWAKYGLAFLGVLALIVFFLPTSYTLGLLDSTLLAVQFIVDIMVTIFQFFMLLITLPFIWLSRLFGGGEEGSPAPPAPAFPDQFQATPEGVTPSWVEIVRSLLFWSIFIIAAVYMIRSYLADHPELWESLKRFRPIAWLFGLAATLMVWLVQFIKAGINLIPKSLEMINSVDGQNRSGASSGWRWPRFGSLSPRQQILYYYLNTLRQAEQVGLIRQRAQTPYEFEPRLNDKVPDVEAEIDLLTEAFVRARYSPDNFDGEHAKLIKPVFDRIRDALHAAGRPPPTVETPPPTDDA
jgi:hypothetical protein